MLCEVPFLVDRLFSCFKAYIGDMIVLYTTNKYYMNKQLTRLYPFKAVVPKLFLLVAPWLMVNPSRGPPALNKQRARE